MVVEVSARFNARLGTCAFLAHLISAIWIPVREWG